jgi:hypothetical protein
MSPSYLIDLTFFTTSLVNSQLFLPLKGLLYTLQYIYIIYNVYNTNSLIKGNGLQFVCTLYSNHMFLLPPSMAVGAAFSWFYLVLCHQTTFYDFLPPLNMYNIPSLLHPYTDTSSYMVKYLCISSYIRKPFLIMSLQPISSEFVFYMRKIFSFFQYILCLHHTLQTMSLKTVIIYTL